MKIFAFLLLMMASLSASADCTYDGNLYPTGAVIGGYTCQADGSWR